MKIKYFLLMIFFINQALNADVTYQCSETKMTVDGETLVTSKKPTIVVSTKWNGKPTMVNVYLRDRSPEIYNKVQFTAINKQSYTEWLKGHTTFEGSEGSSMTIEDKGSYYKIVTKVPKGTFENECVKQ